MDERELQVLQSIAWAVGVLVLIGLAAVAVLLVRRRTIVPEEPASPTPANGPTDWIGLLTAVQAGRIPATSWLALGASLATRAHTCPPPLRAPLITALDGSIARSRDPLASAAMTQLRRALAALPTA